MKQFAWGLWSALALTLLLSPLTAQQDNVQRDMLRSVTWAHGTTAPTNEVPMHTSLSAAAADETAGTPVYVGYGQECLAQISWGTGVTAGAIQIEEASDSTYSGTWGPLGSTVSFSGTAPILAPVQITGFQPWIRARVETAVANGTVTVTIGCN